MSNFGAYTVHIQCMSQARSHAEARIQHHIGLDAKTLALLLAKNKGVDQPAHPRSLISAFVIRYLKSKVSLHSHLCGLQHDKFSG